MFHALIQSDWHLLHSYQNTSVRSGVLLDFKSLATPLAFVPLGIQILTQLSWCVVMEAITNSVSILKEPVPEKYMQIF